MKRKWFNLAIAVACIFSMSVPAMAAAPVVVSEGKKVKMNFTLESDGKIVDKSFETKPFEFIYGSQSLLPGLQKGVTGLKGGDEKKLVLKPEEAFGLVNPQAVVEVPKDRFAQKDIKPGMFFSAPGKNGAPMKGMVKEVRPATVLLDFNHPLAGKTVQFNIKILEVS